MIAQPRLEVWIRFADGEVESLPPIPDTPENRREIDRAAAHILARSDVVRVEVARMKSPEPEPGGGVETDLNRP